VSSGGTFGYQPASIAMHNFAYQNRTIAYASGYEKGVTGQAGINGVDIQDGHNVPVLGQNVVNENNITKLAIDRIAFMYAKQGTYGPLDINSQGTAFESPSIGQLITRGSWDKLYKNATGMGIPGGVFTNSLENIPFVGRRRRRR